MVVEDSKKVSIKMNGVSTQVGNFAHSLRKELYKEHLGMTDEEVQDPLDTYLNQRLTEIAEVNFDEFMTYSLN